MLWRCRRRGCCSWRGTHIAAAPVCQTGSPQGQPHLSLLATYRSPRGRGRPVRRRLYSVIVALDRCSPVVAGATQRCSRSSISTISLENFNFPSQAPVVRGTGFFFSARPCPPGLSSRRSASSPRRIAVLCTYNVVRNFNGGTRKIGSQSTRRAKTNTIFSYLECGRSVGLYSSCFRLVRRTQVEVPSWR